MVFAASVEETVGSPIDPIDLDVFVFKVPTEGNGPGVFERKLTTRPIRAYYVDLARGGRAAVARLDASIPGRLALVTESGTLSRRLAFPSGYMTETGTITEVQWDKGGRHVVLYQQLTSTPLGLSEPYTIGVIDSEDPDLMWHEFGQVKVGTQAPPVPLFETPSL